MKKIKLSKKLGLNKTRISELNIAQEADIKGGAPKSDLVACFLTGYRPGCRTYPCCKSVACGITYDVCLTGKEAC